MDIEVRERDVALSPPPHLETAERAREGRLSRAVSVWQSVDFRTRIISRFPPVDDSKFGRAPPSPSPGNAGPIAGRLVNSSPKYQGREVGNRCRHRNVFQDFFSTAERRADIASLEYAGSFGDSLVSMPQPDSSRVENVLVGSKRITYACTPAAPERAILSNGGQWTHPFEMVDLPAARSRPLGKVVDRNYSSEGMVKRRRANDTTCARAAVPKSAAQLVHKTQARNRKCD